jgi:hypothetical protein
VKISLVIAGYDQIIVSWHKHGARMQLTDPVTSQQPKAGGIEVGATLLLYGPGSGYSLNEHRILDCKARLTCKVYQVLVG